MNIVLTGEIDIDVDTKGTFTNGYFDTITEDDGSYTISASELQRFNEPKASLYVYRAKFKEVMIDQQTYIVVISMLNRIQVKF